MSALDLTLMIAAVLLVFTAFVALPRVVRRVRGDAVPADAAQPASFATVMVEHRAWMAEAVGAYVAGRALPALEAVGEPAVEPDDSGVPGNLLIDARGEPARARAVARLLRRPRSLRDVVLVLGIGSFVTGLTAQPWILLVTLGAMIAAWTWHRAAAAAQAVTVHLRVGDAGLRLATDAADVAIAWDEVAWLTRGVTELGVGRRRLGRRFEIELGRRDGAAPVGWRCETAGDGAPPVLVAALVAARAWVRSWMLAHPFDGRLAIATRGGGSVVWSRDRLQWTPAGGAAPVEVLLDGAEVYVERHRREARLVVRGADGHGFDLPWHDVSTPTCFEEAWRHFLAPWREAASASER